jgi:catechol 2,3-dioxygenase-like lactoylglutathione lyase family enzyme
MSEKVPFEGTYGTMYYVRDMKKSVSYFKELFGAEPLFESPEWTEFGFNGHSLCLHLANSEDTLKMGKGGILITKVKGVHAQVERLKAKGVEFLGDVHEVYPGAYSANFTDPDGNLYSLYEDTTPR